MERELEPYARIYTNPEWVRNMCAVLAGAYAHIESCLEDNEQTALEHETFEGRFDVEEILNWESEYATAQAYLDGNIQQLSEQGKEQLLKFAVSFLDYAYQTPDIFVFTENFEQFLNYYGLTRYSDDYEIEEEEE